MVTQWQVKMKSLSWSVMMMMMLVWCVMVENWSEDWMMPLAESVQHNCSNPRIFQTITDHNLKQIPSTNSKIEKLLKQRQQHQVSDPQAAVVFGFQDD